MLPLSSLILWSYLLFSSLQPSLAQSDLTSSNSLCVGNNLELRLVPTSLIRFTLICDQGYTRYTGATRDARIRLFCLSPTSTCQLEMTTQSTQDSWQVYLNGQLYADSIPVNATPICFGPLCEQQTVCIDTTLNIRLDQYPIDVGYQLVCDDTKLWTVDTLPTDTMPFSTHQVSTCLPSPDSTCQLTVTDSPVWKDGLTVAGQNYTKPGAFTWTVNQTVVAKYDGAKDGGYESLDFCYGPNCCTDVTFDIQVDEFPEEVGFKLVCNDQPVWEAPPGTFQYPFMTNSRTACIKLQQSCCQFTITDSPIYADGLISPTRNIPGYFVLKIKDRIKAAYDGSDHIGYQKLEYWFGQNCATGTDQSLLV